MKNVELLRCAKLEAGLLEGIPPGLVLVLLDGRRRYLDEPGDHPLARFEFEMRLGAMIDAMERPFDQPLAGLGTS